MELFVSQETFSEMLRGLVVSGCQFNAKEENGGIMVVFSGGY